MSLLSQSCAEATRLMSDSRETPLSLPARVGLRVHLFICARCRRYQQQLRLMRLALRQYPERVEVAPLPDEFKKQLTEKLRRRDGRC